MLLCGALAGFDVVPSAIWVPFLMVALVLLMVFLILPVPIPRYVQPAWFREADAGRRAP